MAAFAFGSSQGSWKPASPSQNVVQQNQPIQLQLHVSCTNLRNTNMERAHLHKSDPMCVFFIPQPNTIDNWMLVGHTEVITNDLNPKFVKGFDIDYIFSVIQPLCFEVYDVPHPHRKTDLASQNFIGKAVQMPCLLSFPFPRLSILLVVTCSPPSLSHLRNSV